MAKMIKQCSLNQGFNFQKDQQHTVGHITALTISKQKLEAKLEVQDPEAIDKGTKSKVVGVISNIRWDGGFAEPIAFTCQITAKNKTTVAQLTHQNLANTAVEFAFVVYSFDTDADTPKYYQSFHSNKKSLKGLIEKNDGNLELDIEEEPSTVVDSPRNFELYLSVMPNDSSAEEVGIAVSSQAKFMKNWGVKAS